MASYLDSVPFSGIIRIRDMMYAVADPFRLDQGDVSFDAPDTVKSAMARAIAENKSHYLQTTGVPRLRQLIAAKLRDLNGIPIDDVDDVLVTNGGIHGLYILCLSLLEPGDEVLLPDPEWPPAAGNYSRLPRRTRSATDCTNRPMVGSQTSKWWLEPRSRRGRASFT